MIRRPRLAVLSRRKSPHSTAVTTVPPADNRAGETVDEAGPDIDKRRGLPQAASARRGVLLFGIAALIAVVALGAWLGYRDYETRASQRNHDLFLDVGRQAAADLTSIDYNDVDADLQRITENSTGSFRDDFRQRAPSFAEFVRQIKSISEGTVSEAGVESQHGNEAQVIVAIKVNASSADGGALEQRYWRMRIGVQKVDNTAKVTNVEFVP